MGKTGPKPKPFCGKGHPMSGDNLYLPNRGGRQCKECRRDQMQRYKKNQAAKSLIEMRASVARIKPKYL